MIARWGFYHKYDDYHIFPIAIIAPIGAPKFLYRNLYTNLYRNYSQLFTLRYRSSNSIVIFIPYTNYNMTTTDNTYQA